MLPGQDWRLSIEDAVETSDIVIICLSHNSVTKEGYVQKEIRYAREIALEKPEETIFIIPLRLDECDVPRGLRFYQWADYFGEKKDETYKALLESLKWRHDQKLRIEAQERARQEKEKQDREAVEKAARRKQRKKPLRKAEQEAVEKAVREKEERNAAEKAAREKTEHEAAETASREKEEREAAERAAQERAEQEAAKKISREKAVQENEKELPKPEPKKAEVSRKVDMRFVVAFFGLAAIVIAVIFILPPLIAQPENLPDLAATSTKEALTKPNATEIMVFTDEPEVASTEMLTAKPNSATNVTSTPTSKWITWGDTRVEWPSQQISVDNVDRLENIIQTTIGSAYVSSRGPGTGDLTISPDNEFIAYSWGQIVYLLRIIDGQVLYTFEGFSNNVSCLAFSPDGTLFATGSGGKIEIWKVVDGSRLHSLDSEPGGNCVLSFSPTGDLLVSSSLPPDNSLAIGDAKGIIHLWRVSDGSLYEQLKGEPTEKLYGFAFSPDGELIAAPTSQNRVLVWSVGDETVYLSLEGGKYDFSSTTFSPDGKFLASGANNGEIWIWRVSDGSLNSKWNTYTSSDIGFLTLIFSADGTILASYWRSERVYSGRSPIVQFWQVSDGTLLHEIQNMHRIIFSNDNTYLAGMSNKNDNIEIDLWGLVY